MIDLLAETPATPTTALKVVRAFLHDKQSLPLDRFNDALIMFSQSGILNSTDLSLFVADPKSAYSQQQILIYNVIMILMVSLVQDRYGLNDGISPFVSDRNTSIELSFYLIENNTMNLDQLIYWFEPLLFVGYKTSKVGRISVRDATNFLKVLSDGKAINLADLSGSLQITQKLVDRGGPEWNDIRLYIGTVFLMNKVNGTL